MLTTKDQYIVKLNYLNEGGYWVVGHEVDVIIDTLPENEKCNHQIVEDIVKKMFDTCEIVRVSYC